MIGRVGFFSLCLILVLQPQCMRSDDAELSEYRLYRTEAITRVLDGDVFAAVGLSKYYSEKLRRPEAAYFWARRANKMDPSQISDDRLKELRIEAAMNSGDSEIGLKLPTHINEIVRTRNTLVKKNEANSVAAIAKIRALFWNEAFFAEELFYWSERAAEATGQDQALRDLEIRVYRSFLDEEAGVFVPDQIEADPLLNSK